MPTRDTAATSCAPLRALVLDHDPEHAEIYADILSFVGGGPETCVTTSLTDARQQMAQQIYDVIVLSHRLVGERELLDLRRHQADAIIAVTIEALVSVGNITGQFAAGADEVIQRPYHPSEVAARIDRLLRLRDRARATVAPTALASRARS